MLKLIVGVKGTGKTKTLINMANSALDTVKGCVVVIEKGTKLTHEIKNKASNLTGNMLSQGTTPRRITDLIGSLCDLTSGSGDKGTPVVFIQGYFDNLSDE